MSQQNSFLINVTLIMDKGLYANVHPFESGIQTGFHDKKTARTLLFGDILAVRCVNGI